MAGTYLIRVFAFPVSPDSSIRFAGGEAFLYRLTLTTAGFLDHVFPLAIFKDGRGSVEAVGSNLPQTPRRLTVPLGDEDHRDILRVSHPLLAGTAVATRPTEGKEAHQDVNIRQIMNQAQYLIKKGGGEVKVEMSPEGLGQVHMKMAIHDGKVNLQMATETPEAKQAIEGGMADLKSSLAAHKLSVDHVKVDVVSGSSAGSAADNSQQSFNQQAQRDNSTRQFWNQFQENFGNRSRDDGLTDAPGLKGYGAQRRDPLAPVEGTSSASNRSVEGKGSGLNLVA